MGLRDALSLLRFSLFGAPKNRVPLALPVRGYRPNYGPLALHQPRPAPQGLLGRVLSGRAGDSISTTTPGTGGFQPMWNPATGMGGERDPLAMEQLGITFDQPTREQVSNLLRVSGLSNRIIGIPPSWCTLHGDASWTVQDRSRSATPHLASMARLGLASKFAAADFAGRKGGDAALWIQVEELGVWSEAAQSQPLDLGRVTRIRRLVVVRRHELRPGKGHDGWDDETIEHGEVESWTIRLQRNRTPSRAWTVHSSRLIFFHGTELDPDEPNRPEGWGNDPAIVAVLNAIMTNARMTRGMNRVGDNLFRTIIKTVFPESATTQEFLQGLYDRWQMFRYMGHLGAMMISAGTKEEPSEEVVQLDAPISGISDLIDASADIAAMHTGFPKPLIKGDVAGALGGSGQAESWQASFGGLIHSRQVNYYDPRLRKVYDIQYATVGIYEPDYTLSYAPIILPTGLEEAEERLRLLEGDQIGYDMGALHVGQIARSRFAAGKTQRDLQPALPSEVPAALIGTETARSYGDGMGGEAPTVPALTSLRQIAGPDDIEEAVEIVDPDLASAEEGAAPSAGADPVSGTEPIADLALNGAQIEALLSILERVAAGQLTRAGAVTTITTALPLVSADKARAIVAGVVVGAASEVVEPDPAADPAASEPPAAPTTDDAETYTIPSGARGSARQVLRWRREYGDEVAGMTATGWRRARQLATQRTISREDVVEIAAWFARHGATAATFRVAPEFAETPWKDAGYVSLLGWGGKTMAAWAKARRAAMEDAATVGAMATPVATVSATDSASTRGLRSATQAHALATRARANDADWNRKAYLYATVPDQAAFRDVQAAALKLAPLEGYAPGDPPPDAAHVTVIYYGRQDPADLPELAARAACCLPTGPLALRPIGVTLFPAGPDGRMPVVIELDATDAEPVHSALVRTSARLLAADLHPAFRLHVTLGFLDPDDVDTIDALRALTCPETLGDAAEICLDYAGERVAAFDLTSGDIALGPALDEALSAMVVEHNLRVRNAASKRASLAMLRAVALRALEDAHAEGVGSTASAQNFGRVRAFLYLLRNGRPKVQTYNLDDDLLPAGHPRRAV